MTRIDRRAKLALPLIVVSGLLVSPLAAAPQAEQPQQGGDLDIGLDEAEVKVETASNERTQFEKARTAMNSEDYSTAAVGFHDVLQNKSKKAKQYQEESEYLLAKSLYRLGYYHSALGAFVGVLQKGEKHKFHKTSKEWLFFISRKTADQGVVVEEIARYAANELPEKYADEFHFLLAKLFFRKATEDEMKSQDESVPPVEEEKPEETAPEKPKDEDMEFDPNELSGGGGDDGLDFDLDDLEDDKKKKGKKGKDKDKPPAAPKPGDGLDIQLDDAPAVKPESSTKKDSKPAGPKALVADAKDALEKCIEHATQVRDASPLYLRAVYLRAVCLAELGDFEKAVTGFRDVVKLTNPKGGKFATSTALREEAFFSLARTHYSFQQFRAAIFYYNKINRDSEAWLDSLFESSWAYFRLTDYEKALGNLVTLHAPFFANEYFPESLILKAVTYYENCRYPEALAILTEFEGQYGALRDELEKLTKDAKTPDDYYGLLKKLESQKNSSALTTRLLKLARTDRNLALMAHSAAELEAEEKRITNAAGAMKASPLAQRLLDDVKKRREQVATQAGTIARAKLQGERDELKSLSSQLFRIKFEITKREKEGLEASLRGEKQGTQLGGYRYTTAVADDELYWPFDGEYWRDELGTYQYTLSKGCKQ